MMFWLYRMNNALRRFDGVFIIPVLQTSWMPFSILSGGILFREFEGYRWANYVGFVFGALIIFGGVYQLSPQKPKQSGVARKFSESKQLSELSSPTPHNAGPLLSSTTSPTIKSSQDLIAIDIIADADEAKERADVLNIGSREYRADEHHVLSIGSSPNRNEAKDRLKMNDETELKRTQSFPRPLRNRGALDNLQRFFENSGRIIMKVTGADGRTHLAGPPLSNETL